MAVGAGRRGSIVAGLESVPPASLSFANISLSTKAEEGGGGSGAQRQVLDGIDGIARTGELVAIMGPSGSGKTSLLTSLAGSGGSQRTGTMELSGALRVNGETCELGSLLADRVASYVTQEDCLQPMLTVHESLMFAAELQLPSSPNAARLIRVGEVLRDLRLQHRANDRVETLSGGEKRRLSIGCDGLLSAPLVMFLDEPTSGLSSTDALDVVSAAPARRLSHLTDANAACSACVSGR